VLILIIGFVVSGLVGPALRAKDGKYTKALQVFLNVLIGIGAGACTGDAVMILAPRIFNLANKNMDDEIIPGTVYEDDKHMDHNHLFRFYAALSFVGGIVFYMLLEIINHCMGVDRLKKIDDTGSGHG